MPLNNANMSFKMFLISFHGLSQTQVSSKILYEFTSFEEVALCAEELKLINPRPINGTMVHHVVVSSVDGINYRSTSCYCVNCFKNGVFTYNCDGWNSFSCFQISDFASTVNKSVFTSSSSIEYPLRDFVTAIYEVDHHVYIGTVLEIDELDNEVLVSFMEPLAVSISNSQTFPWPKKPDEIWLKNSSLLCLIYPPRETKRGYKVDNDVTQNIQRQCKNVNKDKI